MAKIAFLFPGQGSQYVGMGKMLCKSFSEAREAFEEANQILRFDLKRLCFEGDPEELTRTENAQPAILTASMAAYRVYLKEIGVKPDFMAGHSLGEITALCCAGGLNFSDAVKIVQQRGRFMQEAVAPGVGGMAAISGVELTVIEDECRKVSNELKLVAISNYNSPDQTVISGHIGALQEVGERLNAAGARIIPLRVSAPFHSQLMQPVADRLKVELEKYAYYQLDYKVVSNVTAKPYPGKARIIEYLTKQIVQPVKWQASMEYLQTQGVDLAVELGPGTVLRNLLKKNTPLIKGYSFDNDADLKELKENLIAIEPETESIKQGMAVIIKCIAEAVCTKNNNQDEQEYQKGVVEPYRQIKKLKDEIEKAKRQPTTSEVRAALEMLQSVFNTKKIPAHEQAARFNDLFETTQTKGVFDDFRYIN